MTRLILIGSRGAGKTSVGRVLAARLARSFIDLDDQAIALAGGGRVRDFLARSGEPAWRALEHRALLAAFESSGPATIVALGGGAVTVPAIRELVESARRLRTARVAFLAAPAETLVARLRADPGDRGSLTGAGLLEELPSLLASREPFYRSLADRTVETAGRDVAAVAAELAAWLTASETLS